MTTRNEITIMADELYEASKFFQDELGEWWCSLASLNPRYRDCSSKSFRSAFEQEIVSEHNRLKAEFTMVEEPYAPAPPMVTRRLVHNSELGTDDDRT